MPVYREREDEAHADAMAARAKTLAPRLGFCGSCGVSVDEDGGKLHDPQCPDVPEERRRAS